MVRVITVEREYGSQGAEFAHRLAGRLNWKLVDRCLIDEIAHKAGVPQSMAEQCDERLDPWYYRMGKSFWHGSVDRLPAPPKDQVFDSERMVEFVRSYLKQCVADGNCVIVGRGAPYILRARTDTFHVFVYGSREKKIQRLVRLKMKEKDAIEMVDTIDKERAAFVRKYFGAEWPCRRLYHLMLNSDSGLEHVTNMVMATMESLERSGKMEPPGQNVQLDPVRSTTV